ncbi:MAG: phasin family protein [Cycloclasticus sp.]|nr:phasin family protein [Cycloclasticus sp.]
MKNDLTKQWAQLSKKAQDSLQKMNALNTASLKQFTKLQMEMVSSCLEGGVEKAKSIGKAASLSDLMDMQSTLYKDLSEKVLKNAQSSVKIAIETKQAMSELIKEGLFTAPPAAVKTKAEKESVKKTAAKPEVKKAVATKPAAKKTAAKVAAKKASVKKVAVKKEVVKPSAKKAAAVARKTVVKTVAKSSATNPDAEQITKKSAATKATTKPPIRKVAASPATKKPKVKPVKKSSAGKPEANKKASISAENLQMPKPAIIRTVEGDAKK